MYKIKKKENRILKTVRIKGQKKQEGKVKEFLNKWIHSISLPYLTVVILKPKQTGTRMVLWFTRLLGLTLTFTENARSITSDTHTANFS